VVFEGLRGAGDQPRRPDLEDVAGLGEGPFAGCVFQYFRVDAELLAELAYEGLFGRFAGLDLAAGSLGYMLLSVPSPTKGAS